MGKNRIELRRQSEAAEAIQKESGAAPTKPARASRAKSAEKAAKGEKATTEKKRKVAVRKPREKVREKRRAIWVIYSGTMREEGRYPYHEKAAAEERLEVLRSRGKRLFFMQMVKELIVGDSQAVTVVPQLDDEEVPAQVAPAVAGEEEEGLSIEIEEDAFSDKEEEEEEEEEEEAADEE